jgi:hypothetical protein
MIKKIADKNIFFTVRQSNKIHRKYDQFKTNEIWYISLDKEVSIINLAELLIKCSIYFNIITCHHNIFV